MSHFPDDDGLFWLPAPTAPRGGGGERKARIHIPRGPLPETHWSPPTDFPRLSGLVALDFETHDPDLQTVGSNWCRPGVGDIAGFALAWPEGERYYPIAHQGGDNLDREACLRYLRDLAESPSVRFVCHNLPYDLGWLWGRASIKPANIPYDTQAAVALLDEYRQRNNQGYNLNAVGRDYCGILKDETLLNEAAAHFGHDPKKDLWRLPARFVGEYAETDAGNTLQIWNVLEPMLRAEKLWDLFMLEMRYTEVITAMRMRGVRVDMDRAERYRKELMEKEARAAAEIKKLMGYDVPVFEKGALERALGERGVVVPRSPTGQASITAPWLKTIDDPLAKLILQIRKWEKVRGTFIEGFFLKLAVNGRIYPQINPLPTDDAGTVSGRSSCTNPNLQQLSSKDPESAKGVRGCILPEEGCRIASLDYSQQEPRLAVHFAYKAGVPGAAKVVQIYRQNPRTDFHQMVDDLANGILGRSRAKVLNLAIIYGRGPAAICRELGFETEWVETRWGKREVAGPEGQAFIDKYYEAVPFVPGLKEACKEAVRKRGYIRTLLGRRCRFGNGKSKDHTAVNRLCQGSAGDQLKKAVVDMYDQLGVIPIMQVHDENVNNEESPEQTARCVEIMVNTVQLEVPVVVDVATGNNWGEAL